GLLVFAAIVTQIVDRLGSDVFVPSKYFTLFTIQSSLMNVVVLLVGGVLALRRVSDTVLYTTMRMLVVVYGVVTGVVYNALIRGGPPEDGFTPVQWPNEVVHVAIPIFLLLDWLLSPGRPALRWAALRIVMIYPLSWLAYTLIAGAVTGWYPYPFLQPETGWLSVSIYIVAISGFVLFVGFLAVAYSRRKRSLTQSPNLR
ncbi:MAG: Pr6Pr family membrane protein, partial [Rhodoglobus sp.]